MPPGRSWAVGGRRTTFSACSIGRPQQRHLGWSSSSCLRGSCSAQTRCGFPRLSSRRSPSWTCACRGSACA
eukprot:14552440-Alexandrium_andersonii.AAC.1